MVLFKRFVEIGRVVQITFGPDAGKVATIVDVIDQNRVLVDGPEKLTGVHRHEINIKRISLTDIKVAAKHNASHKCADRPAPPLPPAAAQSCACRRRCGGVAPPALRAASCLRAARSAADHAGTRRFPVRSGARSGWQRARVVPLLGGGSSTDGRRP